jgi:hypothetical protein
LFGAGLITGYLADKICYEASQDAFKNDPAYIRNPLLLNDLDFNRKNGFSSQDVINMYNAVTGGHYEHQLHTMTNFGHSRTKHTLGETLPNGHVITSHDISDFNKDARSEPPAFLVGTHDRSPSDALSWFAPLPFPLGCIAIQQIHPGDETGGHWHSLVLDDCKLFSVNSLTAIDCVDLQFEISLHDFDAICRQEHTRTMLFLE